MSRSQRQKCFRCVWLLLLLFGLLTVSDRYALCKAQSDICHESEQTYNADASLMKRDHAPTRFRLMPSRYVSMLEAARGFKCTGTTTIGFDGRQYLQTGRSDDPALMELVPTIARVTSMSVGDSYDILMFIVICSGTIVGYMGMWHLYADRRSRGVAALVFVCLWFAQIRVADEYTFQITPLIAGIPWLVYLAVHGRKNELTAVAASMAFCCSLCSLVRSGCLIICLTFVLTLLVCLYRRSEAALPLFVVAAACIPSFLLAHALVARRDATMAKVGSLATSVNSHPFWHTFYIGLGFIPNSEVPEYRDGVADQKVRSIDPTVAYTSDKYQEILKHELWRISKQRPMLVLGIFAAKAAIVLCIGLVLLFPARRLIFQSDRWFWMDAAFVSTIVLSGMNGVVAVPRASYLVTFLCLGFLFTAMKLLNARAERPDVQP